MTWIFSILIVLAATAAMAFVWIVGDRYPKQTTIILLLIAFVISVVFIHATAFT